MVTKMLDTPEIHIGTIVYVIKCLKFCHNLLI